MDENFRRKAQDFKISQAKERDTVKFQLPNALSPLAPVNHNKDHKYIDGGQLDHYKVFDNDNLKQNKLNYAKQLREIPTAKQATKKQNILSPEKKKELDKDITSLFVQAKTGYVSSLFYKTVQEANSNMEAIILDLPQGDLVELEKSIIKLSTYKAEAVDSKSVASVKASVLLLVRMVEVIKTALGSITASRETREELLKNASIKALEKNELTLDSIDEPVIQTIGDDPEKSFNLKLIKKSLKPKLVELMKQNNLPEPFGKTEEMRNRLKQLIRDNNFVNGENTIPTPQIVEPIIETVVQPESTRPPLAPRRNSSSANVGQNVGENTRTRSASTPSRGSGLSELLLHLKSRNRG